MAELSVRERILAATLQTVGQDGVAAVSNRLIASRARVSLGSITYHFPTQNELLREALLGFVTAETERLTALAERSRDSGIDLSEAANMISDVAGRLSFTEEQFASFELYLQAGRDPELREAANGCFTAYDELAKTVLAGLGVTDAESLGPALVATVTGLQLRRLATGIDPDVGAILLRLLGVER